MVITIRPTINHTKMTPTTIRVDEFSHFKPFYLLQVSLPIIHAQVGGRMGGDKFSPGEKFSEFFGGWEITSQPNPKWG